MHTLRSSSFRERAQDSALLMARWLSSLDTYQTWLLLTGMLTFIAVMDLILHPYGVKPGPFYMLPICLACWQLGFWSTFAVTIVTAALSVMTFVVYGQVSSFGSSIANLAIFIVVPGFIAAVVSGLRSAAQRQHRLANYDFLTGALNPMGFADRANALLSAQALINNHRLLCFIDLDGFKQINDRYGHDIGDGLLRSFGAEMQSELRAGDCFGRIGGDEFAWLISIEATACPTAAAAALHRRLTSVLTSKDPELGCSMGALVVPPKSDDSFPTLMRKADQLMYGAKRSGKNQVRVARADIRGDTSEYITLDAIDRRDAENVSLTTLPVT